MILCLFYADSNDETQLCTDYESEGYKCVPGNDCEGKFYDYEDFNPTCSDPSQTCCHPERVKKGKAHSLADLFCALMLPEFFFFFNFRIFLKAFYLTYHLVPKAI